MTKKNQIMIILGILIAFLSGCLPSIRIEGKGGITQKSVEIHIRGINETEKQRWQQLSMTNYWQPDSQSAKSAMDRRITLYMGAGKPSIYEISKKDYPEVWKKWEGNNASYLLVLVDMPIVANPYQDMSGNADARRLLVPLKNCCWKDGVINLAIEEGSVIATNLKSGGMFCDCDID
jgi:hypothetical protein